MLSRDDVISMAREADPAGDAGKLVYLAEIGTGTLERFAAAAYAAGAAAERDACAQVCHDRAMRLELEAVEADADGEHDDAIGLRATAWQISVCEQEIRQRGTA